MSGLPEWLAEQQAAARNETWTEEDAIVARRRLRRRANILDWFQVSYLVVSLVAILALLFMVREVNRRADKAVAGINAVQKVADDFARLAQAPADEREALLAQLERDRQALTAVTSTTTTTTLPPPATTPTTSAPATAPTTGSPAQRTTTTTAAGSPSTTSAPPTTTAPPPPTTTTTRNCILGIICPSGGRP